MKNICHALLLVVVSLQANFNVSAQTTIGIKGGINLNALSIEQQNLKLDKGYPGIHAGVFLPITISKAFSIIPELQFSTRKYDVNIFADDIGFGYLEVPVMLSWRPAQPVSIEAGPYVALKLYAFSENEKGYPKDAFTKSLDAGVAVGVRFHLFNNLAIVPRYLLGIIPVADTTLRSETNQVISDFKAHNRMFQIGLAWTFDR